MSLRIAEVDVGAPDPGVQAAAVEQGGRTLHGRVVLRLRNAAGAAVAVQAGVQFEGQILADFKGLEAGRQLGGGQGEAEGVSRCSLTLQL